MCLPQVCGLSRNTNRSEIGSSWPMLDDFTALIVKYWNYLFTAHFRALERSRQLWPTRRRSALAPWRAWLPCGQDPLRRDVAAQLVSTSSSDPTVAREVLLQEAALRASAAPIRHQNCSSIPERELTYFSCGGTSFSAPSAMESSVSTALAA